MNFKFLFADIGIEDKLIETFKHIIQLMRGSMHDDYLVKIITIFSSLFQNGFF